MEKIFIKKIFVEKVRHLENETVFFNDNVHHLILTGKNGSGKTSLLDAMSIYLDSVTAQKSLEVLDSQKILGRVKSGLEIEFNVSAATVKHAFEMGEFVLAYYKDDRALKTELAEHVEKVELKEAYGINENPRSLFVKYLLDMKMTEALASKAGKNEKADSITNWFIQFENVLKDIFEDESLKLVFDEDTFAFHILQKGKEVFGFNELSRGFAAVLDIMIDLMIRMEKHTGRAFRFDIPGIVLVDEIETHLHLELQKKIMDYLTKLFPNVQFIVSTHSPFILNSISDAVIYDLEKKISVSNGLQNISYDGIVEGYFNVDKLSHDLRTKFEAYKKLISKEKLTDEDFSEIAELEMYLSKIPDYLALDISTEFERLKIEFNRREDI